MRQAYTSDELFHFVGYSSPHENEINYEVLSKVLGSGCVSHIPHEDNWGAVSYTIDWGTSLLSEKLIVPTVTCYADIPFESLGIHMKKYGRFGLSFSRDLLIQYGARPVMYVPLRSDDWKSTNGTTLLNDIEAVYKAFYNHVVSKDSPQSRQLGKVPNTEAASIRAMNSVFTKDFLAFIKPFNSHLDDEHPGNFYQEREWRKHGNLKFSLADVKRIIVARGYSLRVQKDFPQFTGKIDEI